MKIGFLSLPIAGHLNPMAALGRKLQSRGHEIVFIGVPDIEPVVRAADLDFVPFCENEYPPGSVAKKSGCRKNHLKEAASAKTLGGNLLTPCLANSGLINSRISARGIAVAAIVS